jgi:uncharacterized protein YhaN
MRIARLDLRAYGPFTASSLKFGPESGIHLIYGDNEAGKSTTLRALSSVLFGYPRELVDVFRHSSKDMALGAELILKDGRRLDFVRRRTGRNPLVDVDGKLLDEGILAEGLGRASRELFEKVFALDHRRLREQAQSLLADGGALGFSLAEAGSGIAGLKKVLDRLKAERNELFLGGGSKPQLNQLIRKRGEILKDARTRTISPAEYSRQQKQIHEAETALGDARERQKSLGVKIARLGRIGRNLPRRAEHVALSRTLDELAGIPLLPVDVTERRVKAQSDRDTADRTLERVSAALETLNGGISAVSIDRRLLERRAEIASLAETRPGIEKADRDLPRRKATLSEHVARADTLLHDAELAGDAADLDKSLPTGLKRKAITRLADQGARLEAQRATAAEQLAGARVEHKRAEERAAEAPSADDSPPDIKRALAAADKLGDITTQISRRTKDLERRRAALAHDVTALGFAAGDASALRSFVVPPEKTVQRTDESLGAIDGEIQKTERLLAHAREGIAHAERKIAALRSSGRVVSEEDLSAARRTRDRGWALVRARYVDASTGLDEEEIALMAPDGRLADAYERQISNADRTVDLLRENVERVTEVALFERQRLEAQQTSEEAQAALEPLAESRLALLAEWGTLWPGLTAHRPAEMREWVVRRKAVLFNADELEKERDELATLEEANRGAIAGLAGLVRPESAQAVGAGLDERREQAREALGRLDEANSRFLAARAALATQQGIVSQAERKLDSLHAQLDTWRHSWQNALRAAALNDELTIEAAAATIEVMNELDVVNSSIRAEQHRIERIGADRNDFLAQFESLAELVPLASADPLERCRRLETALKESEAAEARLKGLLEQRAIQTATSDETRAALERSRAVLDSLCVEAGCAKPGQLAEVEEKSSRKREASRRRLELESRVREDGAGLDLPSLFAECDGLAGDEIPLAIAAGARDFEEITRVLDEQMKLRAGLLADFERLLTGSQAADCTQQAAFLDSQIAESAEHYVDLTLQEILLERAVALYRERNQGPILARATGLFRDLTSGAYSGLRADIDESGEPVVIAEHATRGALEVAALSDGTRDSLYLALRLAAVEEHNSTREPLPFVADDLLLNLDDARATAAFRTLARISESSQVLFFTHHTHMRDLARQSVPKERLVLHELAANGALGPMTPTR